MKKFIAVIGNRNSGKSTIIQSLTGCPQKGFRDYVIDLNTKKSVFVIASSFQEYPMTKNKFRRKLDSVASKSKCLGVVIAIQPICTRVRISMEEIFEMVQERGGFKAVAFILNPGRNDEKIKVKNIRKRLYNFKLKTHVLDARRFSYVSAKKIQDLTHILK